MHIAVNSNKNGWVCPVCGRGNAPWNKECDCYKENKEDHYTIYLLPQENTGKPTIKEPYSICMYAVGISDFTVKANTTSSVYFDWDDKRIVC